MIVKVCGMTDGENIRQAEKTDMQWMGFIFYPPSPRCVHRKPDYLPETVGRVGVFVDAATEAILQIADEWNLELVQLHGKETPEQCSTLRKSGLKTIKAFSVGSREALHSVAPYENSCDFFLFDTPSTEHGGSGRSFNWSLLKDYTGSTPFLLSGGLNPDSIGALSRFTHSQWAGIDLNSGFELAPGIKDTEALGKFIREFKKMYSQQKQQAL